MKSTEIKSLGFVLNVQTPSSADEFDQLAKRVGACLDEAVNNVLYRSYLAEFRDEFCDALAKQTGIERKEKITGKTKAGNDIVVYAETEVEFVERVAAEKGVEVASFAGLASEVAAKITFDPSATERKAGAKKVAKTYLNIVAQIEQLGGPDGLVKVAAKLAVVLGRPITLDTSTPESMVKAREILALAIKEDQDRKSEAVAKDLLA